MFALATDLLCAFGWMYMRTGAHRCTVRIRYIGRGTRVLSLYVFHPLTLIPILAQWNSNSKESQTLGLLAVDENLLFLEYLCNCNANVGFVSICKKTKTEWVYRWQQLQCYSQ